MIQNFFSTWNIHKANVWNQLLQPLFTFNIFFYFECSLGIYVLCPQRLSLLLWAFSTINLVTRNRCLHISSLPKSVLLLHHFNQTFLTFEASKPSNVSKMSKAHPPELKKFMDKKVNLRLTFSVNDSFPLRTCMRDQTVVSFNLAR